MFENILMNDVVGNLESCIFGEGAKKDAITWISSSTLCLKLNVDGSTRGKQGLVGWFIENFITNKKGDS